MKLKIAMAQIKPITGDLEGNTKKIIEAIEQAIIQEADIVVFLKTLTDGYK